MDTKSNKRKRQGESEVLFDYQHYTNRKMDSESHNSQMNHISREEISALKESPLHFACAQGKFNEIKALIKFSANVNSLTTNNLTPLHVSCMLRDYIAIEFLIKNGANINALDSDFETSLSKVIHGEAKEVQIAKLLIDNGADIDLATKLNWVSLSIKNFLQDYVKKTPSKLTLVNLDSKDSSLDIT